MVWTSDDLVASVRRRGQLPDAAADGAMTDADILELANEEIALRLVPLVRSAREDYFVTYEDQSITSGTAKYRIPKRAQGAALRDVTIVDSDGNESSIPRLSIEEAGEAEQYGVRTVFVMEGNDVRLIPTPTATSGTLRMRYHRAHSRLVAVDETERVANFSGNLVAIASANAVWTARLAASTYTPMDLTYEVPPFGSIFEENELQNIQADTPSSGITTYTMATALPATFPDDSLDTFARLSLADETCIVGLPRECWPLLISAVTSRVHETSGDRDAAQLAFALYERESGNVVDLLTPRVEGARKRIIDHHSPLRARRRW